MPILRRRWLGLAVLLAASAAHADDAAAFRQFLASLRPGAIAAGVSEATYTQATRDLTPDPTVERLAGKQPEFARPIGAYLAKAVTAGRIATGRAKARDWRRALAKAEARYGVDRPILLAVWAIESDFGRYANRRSVVRSLATLAFVGYRGDFFAKELLIALKVAQDAHMDPQTMTGSWAGAMGQPQFLPSSFARYAVDLDGNGTRDIWSSVPDVLGAIANYLHGHGWQRGMPWGVAVRVPPGHDIANAHGSFADWRARGFTTVDGRRLPETGNATLFFPAGHAGPAFLVTANYVALRAYNDSDAYALAVAGLADRIAGLEANAGTWPSDAPLTKSQRARLLSLLAAKGYAVTNRVGRIALADRDSIRAFQGRAGLVPDGHPDRATLERLASQ